VTPTTQGHRRGKSIEQYAANNATSNQVVLIRKGDSLVTDSVTIRWKNKAGEVRETKAKCGDSLLDTAHAHGVDLEGENR
jgi:hypothetical protein